MTGPSDSIGEKDAIEKIVRHQLNVEQNTVEKRLDRIETKLDILLRLARA